jgi:hypothetical protein
MALSVVQLGIRTDTSPGASSEVGPSVNYVEGRNYWVSVTQIRAASTDPVVPTVSGFGSAGNWTQVGDSLWTSSGTNRRRTTLFTYRALSSGTGAPTVSYSAAPANLTVTVVEVTGASATGYVPAATTPVATTASADILREAFSVPSLAASGNRQMMFVACNVSSPTTFRLELLSDTNGDANWTTFTNGGSSSAPVHWTVAGWRPNTPADLSPGFICSTGATVGVVYVELEEDVALYEAPYWGILGRMGVSAPPPTGDGLGSAPLGSSSLGS